MIDINKLDNFKGCFQTGDSEKLQNLHNSNKQTEKTNIVRNGSRLEIRSYTQFFTYAYADADCNGKKTYRFCIAFIGQIVPSSQDITKEQYQQLAALEIN